MVHERCQSKNALLLQVRKFRILGDAELVQEDEPWGKHQPADALPEAQEEGVNSIAKRNRHPEPSIIGHQALIIQQVWCRHSNEAQQKRRDKRRYQRGPGVVDDQQGHQL